MNVTKVTLGSKPTSDAAQHLPPKQQLVRHEQPRAVLDHLSHLLYCGLTKPLLLAFPVTMEINEDNVDDAVLALLWLTLHDGRRAWKGHDWDVLGRLHQKGLILDPVAKQSRWCLQTTACAGQKNCSKSFSPIRQSLD
jgi:hypothetical protein